MSIFASHPHAFRSCRRVLCGLVLALAVTDGAGQVRGPGPATVAKPTPESEKACAELGIGRWIWTTNFTDKQTCRLWRAFTLPGTNAVRKASLRLTADNSYRLFLDGREIGQGGNWRGLTDYDVTWLLRPGNHVLAVEAFNDGLEGGLILGLKVEFADQQTWQLRSDKSWHLVTDNEWRWQHRKHARANWPAAAEVGVPGQFPWWLYPVSIFAPPPLRPIELYFWQTGWFLATVLSICAIALATSIWLALRLALQIRARQMLEVERARIARDIHDDLGAALTQLVLQSEVAQTEFPAGSPARTQLAQFAEHARMASHSLDEVVWAVNSKRDTVRDFASYLCKHAQVFLGSTNIRCRLDVQPDMPAGGFELAGRRGLFLAVKEALNNAAKHSGATEVYLRIWREGETLLVAVEDNGRGFDPAALRNEGNGLPNMGQRLAELGGACQLFSEPGRGCRLEFRMPLAHASAGRDHWWQRWFGRKPSATASELSTQSHVAS